MKIKSILLLSGLFLFATGNAQVSKTVNITAGGLKNAITAPEKSTITELKITGTLNAEDYYYMHDSLTVVQVIDLEEARTISPLDTIPNRAFKNKTTLKSLIVPSTTTHIGDAVFLGCSSLSDVKLPATIKSLGTYAFSSSGITSIELPATFTQTSGACFWSCSKLVKAIVPHTADMFSGCYNLKTIIVPDGVTELRGGAFYQLTSLTNISIPSSVLSIGTQAFYNCINLDSISLSEGLTTVGEGAFWECNKLKSLKLPKSLTTIKSTGFAHCRSLTTVEIPVGATSVESAAFRGCTGLTTIITSTANGIYGGNIFEGCSGIKKIIIPEGTVIIKNYSFGSEFTSVTSVSIPNSVTTIGDNAFYKCSGIDSLSIPESVTSIGTYAFSGCSALKSVKFPNALTRLGSYSFQNCSKLVTVQLPDGITGLEEGVFSACSGLVSVNFPASLVTLGKSVFSDCTSLTLSSLPVNLNSLGESCFLNCKSLKTLTIPSSLPTINQNAFNGCSGLTSVQFPTTLSSIGYGAFSNCNGLTTVKIPVYTSVSYSAFTNCKGLINAVIQYGYNSGNIFTGCDQLKTITIPTGVTSIPNNAFYTCNTLDTINIPSSVRTIGQSAFYGCSKLKSVLLPKLIQTIPNQCFYMCSSLSAVSIPFAVKTIGSNAFDGCTGLGSITVENPYPISLVNSLSVFNNVNKTSCSLYVPYLTKQRYAGANQWNEFTTIVENPNGVFVSSDKVELAPQPGSRGSVEIKANVSWTAVTGQSWLTIAPPSGNGDNTLTFTTDNSQITSIRRATVTVSATGFASQTIEVVQNLLPKTVEITAGGLKPALTKVELNSLTKLTITGTMDARDFKTIRDSMPLIENLDLSAVDIAAYNGNEGTTSNSQVSYASKAIPDYAFFNPYSYVAKTGLKTVLLPQNITKIGNSAFRSCTGLTTMNIPSTVNSIAYYAFYSCQGISSIYVNSGVPLEMGDNWSAFSFNNNNCTLYVPYASKSLYAAAVQWKNFTNIVESTQGFMISANKLTMNYDQGSKANVDIKSNVSWTVVSDQSWLTPDVVSGTGDKTLILTADKNQTSSVRKAIVTVASPGYSSQIIEITQTIAPKAIEIVAGGLSTTLSADELNSLSSITLTGTMDARDFKTLRDKMPLLSEIDLSGISIMTYSGTEGTVPYSSAYPAGAIPQNAFNIYNTTTGKKLLNRIILPQNLSAIGSSAFAYCTGLSSVTIPSSVNGIGDYAFRNCTGLSSLNILCSFPPNLNYYYTVFTNVNTSACTLNVPYKSKSQYSVALGWKDFINITENPNGFMTNANTLKVPYVEGTNTALEISANVPWSVVSDQSWLKVSPTSGSGDTKLTVTVDKNDSTTRRFANITLSSPGFGALTIKVTQTGAPLSINLTAGNLSTALTSDQLNYTTELLISGTMDARDFKTMRDLMPELTKIDLSKVSITAFSGDGGTYDFSTSYSADQIPPSAFFVYSFERAKTGLTSIKFPSSLKFIGSSAFQGCTGLTSVYLNTVYPFDFTNYGDPFYKTNKAACTLYVPYATKPLYASALYWKEFVNITEAESGFLIGQKALRFNASTKSKTMDVAVKANVNWTAVSDQPWLAVQYNDSSVTLTAEPNPLDTIRKANVIVSAAGFDPQIIDITQAAAPRRVTAGNLSNVLTTNELNSLTEIALMGTIDARDFKTMRESMPKLTDIDLLSTDIVAYEGQNCSPFGGTNVVKYPANEVPEQIFYYSNKLKTIILPQSTKSIGKNAFYQSALSMVSFSNSISSVGAYAFGSCKNLSSLTLPDSLKTIREYAFSECTNLSGRVVFPSSVKVISNSAFSGCSGLTGELIIPSTVDTLGNYAFNGCYQLTTVSIRSANTLIGDGVFTGCWWLTKVNIPSGLTSISNNLFTNCMRLEQFEFPSGLKTIGNEAFLRTGLSAVSFPATLNSIGASSFSGTKIAALTIPSTLTTIGKNAFSDCTELKSVELPSTLKSIPNGLFSGCTGLTAIEFPLGLQTIGDAAFSGCTGLVSVNLPSLITSVATYTFSGCTGLQSVNFPTSLTSIGSNAFANCTGLTSLSFPDQLKTIGYAAFTGCSRLSSASLPPALLSIDAKVFESCYGLLSVSIPTLVKSIGDYSFSNCTSLTSVTIPSNVESLGEGSFYNCKALNKIDMAPGVKSIGNKAFQFCRGLTSITIPSSVKTIGGYTFDSCDALKTVTLNENLESLDYYCFSGCSSLTNINLPNTLKSMGGYCFINCISLKSIVIPPLVTEVGGFSGCSNLTSVTLNEGLKTISGFGGCGFSTIVLPNSLENIGYMAFSSCKNLSSVIIPSNVKVIDDNAFNSCTALKTINIPAGVTEIGAGAFGACTGLTSVYAYPAAPVDMAFSGDGFYGVNKTGCNLYVPLGKKTAYASTQYWKDFSNIIEMPTAVKSLNADQIQIIVDPNQNSFKLSGIDGSCNVSVYDLKGNLLIDRKIKEDESLQLSNLSNGIYVVKICSGMLSVQKKFIHY